MKILSRQYLIKNSIFSFFSNLCKNESRKISHANRIGNSVEVIDIVEKLPKSTHLKTKSWSQYLLHCAMLKHHPFAPLFIEHFANIPDKRRSELVGRILRLKMPPAAKIYLFQQLRLLDKNDSSVIALGVLFHCQAGNFAEAHQLVLELEKCDRPSTTAERASLAYRRCMTDFALTRPRNLGRARVLDIMAERLSAETIGFERDNAILHILPSLGPGGAQKQFISLMTELRSRGWNKPVFALPITLKSDVEKFYVQRCAELDIHIIEPRSALSGTPPSAIFHDPAAAARWIDYLDKAVRDRLLLAMSAIHQCRPYTVQTWTNHCNIAGGLAALVSKVDNIILGARSIPPTAEHYRYDLQLYHNFLTTSPRVTLVTNSINAKKSFIDYLDKTANDIQCIYNGVSFEATNELTKEKARLWKSRPLGIPENALIVGGMFRLNHEKMPLFWLEVADAAVAARPDIYFVIIGEGKMRPEMEAFIKRRGLEDRVFLVGLSKDTLAWHAVFDLTLLLSKFEGTPNVLLEAQYMGVPVVARDVGGCSECFIAGSTGFLIPVDYDAGQVASVVVESLDKFHPSSAISSQARRFVVEKFDLMAAADSYLKLYQAHSGSWEHAKQSETMRQGAGT